VHPVLDGENMTNANTSLSSEGRQAANIRLPRTRTSQYSEKLTHCPQIFVTQVGLQIPESLSYEDWENAGKKLVRMANTSAWCLGDWILHGQEHFHERYRYAAENAGLDYQTLRNYAWVSRKVPQERRHHQLSFQHHAEVASLDAAEQIRWLRLAEANSWTRNNLRTKIRSAAGRGAQRPANANALSQLAVAPEHLERWRAAAELASTSLECWLVDTLNNAANKTLCSDDPG
jgi:hypothetical protein